MRKIKSITTKKGRTQPFFLFYFFCCVPAFKTGDLFAYESAKMVVNRLIARFPGVDLPFAVVRFVVNTRFVVARFVVLARRLPKQAYAEVSPAARRFLNAQEVGVRVKQYPEKYVRVK